MDAGLTTDYSGMLTRIAISTFFTSLGCSILIIFSSSYLQNEINTLNGYLTNMGFKFTWLSTSIVGLLPAIVVAVITRIVMFHDRISDLLGIRKRFDVYFILVPMALQLGLSVTESTIDCYHRNRNELMGKVFYVYAGYNNPVIDKHLIQKALDHWMGFWMALEGVTILTITGICLVCLGADKLALTALAVAILFVLFLGFRWRRLKRNALSEVLAILSDAQREQTVKQLLR